MKNGPRIRYSGNLSAHWNWSIYLAFSMIALCAVNFSISYKAGYVTVVFSSVYFLLILAVYFHYRPKILQALVSFAARFEQEEEQILKQIELPIAIVTSEGRILWMNDRLCELTQKPDKYHKNIASLFKELERDNLPETAWDKDITLTYDERNYRAHIQRITLEGLIEDTTLIEQEKYGTEGTFFYMIYLIDETELKVLRQENRDEKNVISLIYIDNYEEAMDNVDEVHQSLMNVLVDREINKYFSAHRCLSKKLEKDKYLVVMNRKSLDELTQDHFSVLEEVKTINIGNDVGMTVSIGVGLGGKTYLQNYEYARSAIEMALGRGGDQAVVNKETQMTFFGGKSQRNERNTRVKARVKAQAMREIIESTDRVIAMGHKITDMDSLGAAIGVYRAARTLGKPAWIVIGEDSGSIRSWVQELRQSRDYAEDLFISHEKAIELTDRNTAVIVVDTNRPEMVECTEILQQTETVVVLDHHRRTTEQIQNAALSYIEPSASSASEMVAEVLQYFEEDVRLKGLEADCMYAGIIIDTNNFVAKTGARTFEAAAYLRRAGADITRVRKALRDDMDSYKARAEAVRHAEQFMGSYAISVLPSEGLESPNVIGQAANELLDIIGVKASFVVTKYDNRVFISARAIDEVNVQVIMERLGGGGHMNIAGAQLKDVTCEEAVAKLKGTLTAMTEAGEI